VLTYKHGGHIGVTDFFRNMAFLETLADLLRDLERPRVLFHACSVGAEPYSFAIVWRERVGTPIEIEATDIEPEFLKLALKLEHPLLTDKIRGMVTFLPACSVTSFSSVKTYDAVICMNALCYLTPDEQVRAVWMMSSQAVRYLCVSAADPRSLKLGIREANMHPVWKNWLAIYYGWRERLSLRPRGKAWKLPYIPFLLAHWRYAGTSIFARELAVMDPKRSLPGASAPGPH